MGENVYRELRDAIVQDRIYEERLEAGEDPIALRREMRRGFGAGRRLTAYGHLWLRRGQLRKALEAYDRAALRGGETYELQAEIIERHRVKIRAEFEEINEQISKLEALGIDELSEIIDATNL